MARKPRRPGGSPVTSTPWREPMGRLRQACTVVEAARRLEASESTIRAWKRQGLLGDAVLEDGRVMPHRLWRLWREREEERSSAATRRLAVEVVAGAARPRLGSLTAEEVEETIRLREYWEARKIREDGEKARLAAEAQRLKLEREAGNLVHVRQVREAFRELAGSCAQELLMLSEAAWVEPTAALAAREAAEEAGRRLQAQADAVSLTTPLDDEESEG